MIGREKTTVPVAKAAIQYGARPAKVFLEKNIAAIQIPATNAPTAKMSVAAGEAIIFKTLLFIKFHGDRPFIKCNYRVCPH